MNLNDYKFNGFKLYNRNYIYYDCNGEMETGIVHILTQYVNNIVIKAWSDINSNEEYSNWKPEHKIGDQYDRYDEHDEFNRNVTDGEAFIFLL